MLKKILSVLGLIAIVIAGSIGRQIGKELSNPAITSSTPSPPKIEEILKTGLIIAADKINKQGPIMVDADTRMDSASVGPGSRLTYFYTLPKYSSKDVESNWLHNSVKPVVKMNVCASKEMKPVLQYGATLVYAYNGNNGKEITRFEINKNDCN